MHNILLVGFGGFLGAVFRYGLSFLLKAIVSISGPFDTMIINILGSLAIGFLIGIKASDAINIFFITGVLGAFTTFSSFSADTVLLIQSQKAPLAIIYFLFTPALCLLVTWIGLIIARNF